MVGTLGRRVAALEAIRPGCRACAARPVFQVGGEPAQAAPCPECGRLIEPLRFTLDIGAASGRGDDDL